MKTYAEKRFFKWQEDDVAVSLRAKSGSYGGGSEVLVIAYNQISQSAGYKEDDITVSLTVCGGTYGGGSEVLVVGNTAENTVAYGIDSYNQSYFPETAPTIKTNGGGDSFPKVIVFRDDVTIKIDEEDVAFTLGARDFKGVQCVSYESSKHREWATAQCEHDGDHESVGLHARCPSDS